MQGPFAEERSDVDPELGGRRLEERRSALLVEMALAVVDQLPRDLWLLRVLLKPESFRARRTFRQRYDEP
jgi:hypothetical protein